ncbi:hypothetical protein T440DRAFT_527509 [Plenodomus tracheiphilus IPT5]|uniref:Uncharacterized protein n=1 Tax=Plenodomus tracheiphilus IPT5 TaxID=1408161 RepID=A0A6A7BB85_9PLEO|nr:hypothetical protein T440DRAFT_527509 [Plenodomus tracheiphilus IPT5]
MQNNNNSNNGNNIENTELPFLLALTLHILFITQLVQGFRLLAARRVLQGHVVSEHGPLLFVDLELETGDDGSGEGAREKSDGDDENDTGAITMNERFGELLGNLQHYRVVRRRHWFRGVQGGKGELGTRERVGNGVVRGRLGRRRLEGVWNRVECEHLDDGGSGWETVEDSDEEYGWHDWDDETLVGEETESSSDGEGGVSGMVVLGELGRRVGYGGDLYTEFHGCLGEGGEVGCEGEEEGEDEDEEEGMSWVEIERGDFNALAADDDTEDAELGWAWQRGAYFRPTHLPSTPQTRASDNETPHLRGGHGTPPAFTTPAPHSITPPPAIPIPSPHTTNRRHHNNPSPPLLPSPPPGGCPCQLCDHQRKIAVHRARLLSLGLGEISEANTRIRISNGELRFFVGVDGLDSGEEEQKELVRVGMERDRVERERKQQERSKGKGTERDDGKGDTDEVGGSAEMVKGEMGDLDDGDDEHEVYQTSPRLSQGSLELSFDEVFVGREDADEVSERYEIESEMDVELFERKWLAGGPKKY